jgi:hypothetical protein
MIKANTVVVIKHTFLFNNQELQQKNKLFQKVQDEAILWP